MKGRQQIVAALLLLVSLCAVAAFAQPAQKTGDWITISPPDEGFAIQLPVKPEEQTDRSTYETNTYKMRLYTSSGEASGLLYMVVMQEFPELSGILEPAVRFDKFMEGFKEGFAQSLGESAKLKVDLQPDRDLSLKGTRMGRQYLLMKKAVTFLISETVNGI